MKIQRTIQKVILAIILTAFLLLWGSGLYRDWHESRSGIPDAVSSRTENRECFLDVIANADEIEDKEAFARTVIQMCRENAFRSIRLSTDLYGYPEKLEISVYLHRGDVNRQKPVMRIRYEPIGGTSQGESSYEYNIRDDAEKYRLYLE